MAGREERKYRETDSTLVGRDTGKQPSKGKRKKNMTQQMAKSPTSLMSPAHTNQEV